MTNRECCVPPLPTPLRQVVYGSILYIGVKYPARCERAAEQRGNQFLRNAIILMASLQNLLLLLHKPSAFLYFCLSLFHSIFGRITIARPKTCKMNFSFCKQKKTSILRYVYCNYSDKKIKMQFVYHSTNSFILLFIHVFSCSPLRLPSFSSLEELVRGLHPN
jgi:hypothetical protein